MPVRMTVILEPEERDALIQLALKDKRKPYFQAALIIREELERRGLLAKESNTKGVSNVK